MLGEDVVGSEATKISGVDNSLDVMMNAAVLPGIYRYRLLGTPQAVDLSLRKHLGRRFIDFHSKFEDPPSIPISGKFRDHHSLTRFFLKKNQDETWVLSLSLPSQPMLEVSVSLPL
jgi:hypothetical protein